MWLALHYVPGRLNPVAFPVPGLLILPCPRLPLDAVVTTDLRTIVDLCCCYGYLIPRVVQLVVVVDPFVIYIYIYGVRCAHVVPRCPRYGYTFIALPVTDCYPRCNSYSRCRLFIALCGCYDLRLDIPHAFVTDPHVPTRC